MFEVNRYESLLLSAIGLASLLCVGVGCYFVSELFKFQSQWWFLARWSSNQLIIISLCEVIFLVFRMPVLLWYFETVEVKHPRHLTLSLRFYNAVVSFVNIVPLCTFVLVYSGRHFIQWFHANLAMVQSNWPSLIDDSLVSNNTPGTSWFIRNKDTLGNRSFIGRVSYLLIVVLSLVFIISNWQFNSADTVFMGIMVTCFSVFLVYTSYTYPAGFKDDIFIKEEKTLTAKMCLFITLAWVSFEVFPFVIGWSFDHHSRERKMCLFLSELVLCSFWPVYAYSIGPSVIVRFRRPVQSLNLCGSVMIPLLFAKPSDDSGLRRSLSHLLHRSGDRQLNLDETMADNIAFRKFVAHLFGEYSFENVLCFVECVKWRDRMSELLRNGSADCSASAESTTSLTCTRRTSSAYTPSEHGLCSEITETNSTIVSGLHSMKQARQVAMNLCDKYITNNATYHVNLGYRTQQKVLRMCDDPERSADIDEMLFDDVINDCKRLLKDSFSRFAAKGPRS